MPKIDMTTLARSITETPSTENETPDNAAHIVTNKRTRTSKKKPLRDRAKQTNIYLNHHGHRAIRIEAAKRGCSMNDVVIEALDMWWKSISTKSIDFKP